jgi:hypothetical protein
MTSSKFYGAYSTNRAILHFVQVELLIRRGTGSSAQGSRKSALQETLYDPTPDFVRRQSEHGFRLSGAKSEEVFYEV